MFKILVSRSTTEKREGGEEGQEDAFALHVRVHVGEGRGEVGLPFAATQLTSKKMCGQ